MGREGSVGSPRGKSMSHLRPKAFGGAARALKQVGEDLNKAVETSQGCSVRSSDQLYQ